MVKTIAETRHPEKIIIRLPDTEYLQNWAGHVSVSHARKKGTPSGPEPIIQRWGKKRAYYSARISSSPIEGQACMPGRKEPEITSTATPVRDRLMPLIGST